MGKSELSRKKYDQSNTMNVGHLKEVIDNLPDNMEVFVGCQGYTNYDFEANRFYDHSDTFCIVHDGKLFIVDEGAIEIDKDGNTI